MSRLDELIFNWNRELAATETMSPDDTYELESHLRESTQQLLELAGSEPNAASSPKASLSVDEAFLIARRRLGNSQALSGEFQKTNGNILWRRRALWMLVGYVMFSCLSSVVTGIASLSGAGTAMLGGNSLAIVSATFCAQIVGWLLLLAWIYRLGNRGKGSRVLSQIAKLPTSTLALGLLAGIGIARMSGTVMPFIASRQLTPDSLGRTLMLTSYLSMFSSTLILVACIAVIVSLRRGSFAPQMDPS